MDAYGENGHIFCAKRVTACIGFETHLPYPGFGCWWDRPIAEVRVSKHFIGPDVHRECVKAVCLHINRPMSRIIVRIYRCAAPI